MTALRWLTAGESHGPACTAIVEGIPAGLPLLAHHVDHELARRQRGYGRGGRQKIERDRVRFLGGVRGGETLGGPIALCIENLDYAKWADSMSAGPHEAPPERVTRPRPGHADLAGALKYDRHDARDVLERASARETASRVAVGAVCRRLLAELGVRVGSYVTRIEQAALLPAPREAPTPAEYEARFAAAEASDVRCPDEAVAQAMREAILAASHAGDTVGGVVEVVALGLMPGLGSHVQWDRKLDGRLGQAILSIQAFKGVEVGLGFEAAARRGSAVHDAILHDAVAARFTRPTNGAGGLEGGITNGMPLVVRGAMKPISTLRRALPSVDLATLAPFDAAFERSDVCAVPAAGVIAEAMVCAVLAESVLEKFGADSLSELRRNVAGYLEALAARGHRL
jgi:chorismate synthase